jgi:hypothetical protein
MSKHSRTYWMPSDFERGTCDVHDGLHLWSHNDEDPCIGWNEYLGRHARRPETILVYIGWREDGEVHGEAIRGSGDDVETVDFIVEDNEPDDVWGPILSRIAEECGLNGSPEHCDGGEVRPHGLEMVGMPPYVAVLELRHDGTPS